MTSERSLELYPKPQHPRIESCSKQECLTMVDVACVKLAAQMTTKYDEKLRDRTKDTMGRVELMISNSFLKVKDELHREIREMEETMHAEIRKILDERLTFLTEKLQTNGRTLNELQTKLATLKTDFAENDGRRAKELRTLDLAVQKSDSSSVSNATSLKQLRTAVETLYTEFNRRSSE